jgi:hypothetical protein
MVERVVPVVARTPIVLSVAEIDELNTTHVKPANKGLDLIVFAVIRYDTLNRSIALADH